MAQVEDVRRIVIKIALKLNKIAKAKENGAKFEKLQNECVSFMISAFNDKKDAFDALSNAAEGIDNVENAENSYFVETKHYLRRHPEFQQVFQKYKKVCKKHCM